MHRDGHSGVWLSTQRATVKVRISRRICDAWGVRDSFRVSRDRHPRCTRTRDEREMLMIARKIVGACVAFVAASLGIGCASGDAHEEGGESASTFTTACPGAWASAPNYDRLAGT